MVIRYFITTLIMCALSGCMNAAITGVQVAYNHDHIQKSLSDQYITTLINRKLFRDTDEFDNTNISVSTFHQVVLLTGQVPTQAQHDKITEIVHSIHGIKKIYNLIEISQPIPTLSRIQDSWITTKIKSQLIATNDIDPDQIKVITEHNQVFLMGMILEDQADTAADIARHTDGVKQVVKLFTYLKITNA